MSDEQPGIEPGAEEAAPETVGIGATEATPERTYLPTDDYSEHYVRVKVDGQEEEVPLSEALQGYSRQQDYTRKTQQLAEQQRELQFAWTLQQALENNPQATLQLLQQQYGIGTPQGGEAEEDWEELDPVEQRLRQYDERFSYLEQQQANQELQVAVRVLQQRYGEDFDPYAVVQRAAAQQRMDLENVFKEMAFEKFWTDRQAQAEVASKRQAEDAARVAAKSQNPVHTGSSVNGAVGEEPSQALSIAEAFAQAKHQLGM